MGNLPSAIQKNTHDGARPMTTVLNDKTVLVIGHGLAGKTTVAALQRNGVRILVVESRNYYEPDTIAPLILSRSAVQATFTVPQSLSRVPGVEYIEGTVDTIDKSEGRLRVVLKTGEKISADAVVCCTGSTIPFLKPDLGAMPEERRNQLASARKAIAKAKTILVAGGGTVGIELAGAVCELKAQSAKVILAVSGETILHDGFPMGMRTRVAKVLTNAGVQILPNAKVTGSQIKASLTPSAYELSDGSTVNADVFLPSFSSFELPSMPSVEGATDARGRLIVDGSLQSVKIPGVFAVACASVDKILNLHALRLLMHSTGGQGREPDPAEAAGRRQEPTSLPEDEVAGQRPRRPDPGADGRIVRERGKSVMFKLPSAYLVLILKAAIPRVFS